MLKKCSLITFCHIDNLLITLFQSIFPFLPLANLTTSQSVKNHNGHHWEQDNINSFIWFFLEISTTGSFLWQIEAPTALWNTVHTSPETWHLCWLLVWDKMSNKRDWKMQRLRGKWPEKERQSSWLLMETCWAMPAETRII